MILDKQLEGASTGVSGPSMSKPRTVSVIMPAYNAQRYLTSAIASVQTQTYPHWELIVIDDASRDTTLELARELAAADSRIRVLNQPVNKGVAEARNLGLDHATGELIAFLDSDDLWFPEKLSRQIGFMTGSGALVSYTAYQRMDESGRVMGVVRPPVKLTYAKLLRSNFIGNLTGVYDAKTLGKQYLTEFKHEDYVAWLSLVKKAGVALGMNEVLASYRVYSGSTSSNKLKTSAWQWRIYRESQGLGRWYSAWLMACYAGHAMTKRLSK